MQDDFRLKNFNDADACPSTHDYYPGPYHPSVDCHLHYSPHALYQLF